MEKLIVANWKLNPATRKEAEEIFGAIKNGAGDKCEVVICPPFVYLPILKGIKLGAQNVSAEEKGAFTGEVSVKMLKDLGAEYAIIGHSERRKYFGETDEIVNKKIKSAMAVELEQIFCVGETEEERNEGRQEEVVERQIKKGLEGISDLNGIVIAYEPVWAIGTGKACEAEDAKKMKDFIKSLVPEARILYGGSVNSQNSTEYLKDAGYDGLLVGGASLKPEEFIKIIKSVD